MFLCTGFFIKKSVIILKPTRHIFWTLKLVTHISHVITHIYQKITIEIHSIITKWRVFKLGK